MAWSRAHVFVAVVAVARTDAFAVVPLPRPACLPATRALQPLHTAPAGRPPPSRSGADRLRVRCASKRCESPSMNSLLLKASPILLGVLAFRYAGRANPLLMPLLLLQDGACLFVDVSCGLAKLGWRLAIAAVVVSSLLKVVFKIVMAGGPLKAGRRAFFGAVASASGGAGAFCEERPFFERWAAPLNGLATSCEGRMPEAGANPFAGLGAGANPFSAGATNPFDNPFGGGDNPFGGGANPFEAMLGDAAPPAAGSKADGTRFEAHRRRGAPFTATSATPGVTVKVRRPGDPKPSDAGPAASAEAAPEPPAGGAASGPGAEPDGPVIDVPSEP